MIKQAEVDMVVFVRRIERWYELTWSRSSLRIRISCRSHDAENLLLNCARSEIAILASKLEIPADQTTHFIDV